MPELMDTSVSEELVQVRLIAADKKLRISEEPPKLLVQATLNRYKLSLLVNELLQDQDQRIPFDFLINGKLLHTSIDTFLKTYGISTETILDLKYTRALLPPLQVTSFEQEALISSVDVLSQSSPAGQWSDNVQGGQERILTASYDGLLRIWNTSGNVLATSELPNSGGRIPSLKTTRWLSNKRVVAAGMDSTVRVYNYNEDTQTITNSLELLNHRMMVCDLAVHEPSGKILSASVDTTISLFSAKAEANPAAPTNLLQSFSGNSGKRRKPSSQVQTVPARGAIATLSGHDSPVSSVAFKPGDITVAYSASYDHAVKTWDLTTSTCVMTRKTNNPLFSLCPIPSRDLLAVGTSARHVNMIDCRASSTHISVMTLRGHLNAISSIDTHPTSDHYLVSGSHDGTVRIWDIRNASAVPANTGEGLAGESVYTILREGENGPIPAKTHGEGIQVYSVQWNQEVGIVAGGADKKVQINRSMVS